MSHYYTHTGEPRHFEGKDGGPTTLKEARAQHLLPSVTTIIGDVLRKPGLEKWLLEQRLLAALTLPRNPDESEHDFAKRAIVDAEQQAEDARNKGTEIHDAIEKMQGDHATYFGKLCVENGWNIVWQERRLVGEKFAGTADVMFQDFMKQYIIADLKGKDLRIGKRGGILKPFIPDDWIIQLAAYSLMTDEDVTGAVSIIFDREHADRWYVHNWSAQDLERGRRMFLLLLELWCLVKRYDPQPPPKESEEEQQAKYEKIMAEIKRQDEVKL